MPLDPVIARGVVTPGLGGSLIAAEEIKNRRGYNNALMQRNALEEQAQQAAASKDAEEAELRLLYKPIKAGDPRAIERALSVIAQRNPQAAEVFRAKPGFLAEALEQGLGIQPEAAAKPDYRTVGGALVEITPEGPREAYRPAQRAPLRAVGGAVTGPVAAPPGKAPMGYRWTVNGELEPIPGGPAASKQETAERKETVKAQQLINQIGNVNDVINEAIALAAKPMTTGFVGGNLAESEKLSKGTDARELRGKLTTIKANIGFDRLQAMREASPTGGALGQVAVQELEALQASIAALDQGLKGDALIANLKKIRTHYRNWKDIVSSSIGNEQIRTTPENRVPRTQAPAQALEYLKTHPETKGAFFEKYGYLPNGN